MGLLGYPNSYEILQVAPSSEMLLPRSMFMAILIIKLIKFCTNLVPKLSCLKVFVATEAVITAHLAVRRGAMVVPLAALRISLC